MFDYSIQIITSLFIFWLFCHSAWLKFNGVDEYVAIVNDFEIFNLEVSHFFIVTLATTEVIASYILFLPFSGWEVVPSLVILSVYFFVILINLLRGRRDIKCGCAGFDNEQSISPRHLWRLAILIGMLLSLSISVSSRSLGWLDYFNIVIALIATIVLYQSIDRLMENSSKLVKINFANKFSKE